MGASIQWRQPPPSLRNRHYGATVEFGRGRSAGRGYMAASSRVGPGVLVLDDAADATAARGFADALNESGFTALAFDYSDVEDSEVLPVLEAAAEFLVDNWHPRLGVIGFESQLPAAIAVAQRARAEALVAYAGDSPQPWDEVDIPCMAHVWGDLDESPLGEDAEVHIYDGSAGEEAEVGSAFERTLDFLTYHLS